MNQEQMAYLRARELEAYFREKVDLRYKGLNGDFSEYEVTKVNNRSVKRPLTVGVCQSPDSIALYLHADLSRDKQGTAKIEFDLSGETLQGLRTGNHKVLFLESLQTAVAKRALANAEGIAGQSQLSLFFREVKNTLANPFRQWMDTAKGLLDQFPGGPFGTPPGNTVTQAKPSLILQNVKPWERVNLGLRNTAEDRSNSSILSPDTPISVRGEDLHNFARLAPEQEYELSFARYCSNGVPHQKCVFTPTDKNASRIGSVSLEYDGMRTTDNGLEFYLGPDQHLSLSVSEQARGQEQTHDEFGIRHEEQRENGIEQNHLASKTKGTRSLDDMIASAQARASQQAPQKDIQHDHTLQEEHSR